MKKEMIEEMASDMDFACVELSKEQRIEIARTLINLDYCKIPEGSVVVDKEYLKKELQGLEAQARKETAKEILQEIKLKCKELEDKYSHLCKSKKECLMETCRYEGVLAVKRELYELAKKYGVKVE